MLYVIPIILTVLPSIPKITKGDVEFNKRIMFCSFVRHSEFKLAGVIKKVVFLCIAASVILFSYIRIYCASRKTLNTLNNVNGAALSRTRIKKDLALLRTVKVIFVAFVICYLPLSIVYGIDTKRDFPYWMYFIGVTLLWMSSSINWMIYFCTNHRFRMAYTDTLCCRKQLRVMSSVFRFSSLQSRRSPGAVSLRSIRSNGSLMNHSVAIRSQSFSNGRKFKSEEQFRYENYA